MQVSRIPILLVEDDEELRAVMAQALAARGYAVSGAANGGEALVALATGEVRPAVVVLDLSMPVMNGESFLTYTRKLLDEVPIVVLSGEPERAASLVGSVFHVLTKPVGLQRLVEVIGQASLASSMATPRARLSRAG